MSLYPDEHFPIELDEQQRADFGQQLAEEVVSWASSNLEVDQVFPVAKLIEWVQANPEVIARNISAERIYTRKQLKEALNDPA